MQHVCTCACMFRHLVAYIFPTVANLAINHPIQEAVNYKHTHTQMHMNIIYIYTDTEELNQSLINDIKLYVCTYK